MSESYQMCSKCIMDSNDDPKITFDEKGVCSYCCRYDELVDEHVVTNEAERTATKVMGRNFINSPTIPGQKINGKKAAKVVAVDAIIGKAILLAAILYASRRRTPRFC